MYKINRHICWTCCIAALFLFIGDKAGAKSRPLFASDSTIAVTIEGPLSTIMRNRDETDEYPATLKFTDADGTERGLEIRLRVRGKYRRKRDVCSFAPLRLNFQKAQVEGTVFAGQDKIKLVTDCQSSRPRFQQYLLKEYLTYRFFNVLTDTSFGARLLRVTYVDTDKKNRARESYAFFIEEKKHIAERLGIKRLNLERTSYNALDPAHSNLVNVFEYFIGNTDFSLIRGPSGTACCHNATLYQKDNDPIIPIPYDFDHAGMVDAPYAAPNPRFKIKSVRQRLYRGRCTNNSYLDSTMRRFIEKRDDVYQLVENLEGFNQRSIKLTKVFIDSFYKDISSQKYIEKKLLKRCN
ncbi:MAG: hypothetical protein ACE5OQ_06470 [Woeseia sp.]